MKRTFAFAVGISSLFAASPLCWAEETVIDQNNFANVKAIILLGDQSSKKLTIKQTGNYNAAAVVSAGTGGYTAIYQSGGYNSAIIDTLGTNHTVLLEQAGILVRGR